jgi:hypothetical protein
MMVMCFMFYVGTEQSIPRRAFDQKAPGISVQDLDSGEESIRLHFHKPEVQNIGSTSNCGCDFPSAILQGDAWPQAEYYFEPDKERAASDQFNREALVALLRSIREESVELYVVWSGDYVEKPHKRETISVDEILDRQFRFKELCFYEMLLSRANPSSATTAL